MLRNIKLFGELADKYGKQFKLDVESVGEALHAINILKPGFLKDIKKDEHYNVVVGDLKDENCLDQQTIQMKHKRGDIWIMPEIIGRKSGVFQTILGAVMIIVGAVMSVYGMGMGAPLIKMGIGMMISGVAMMLCPVPGAPDYAGREKPDERPSFLFDGPVNTNEQGGAIPIVYGRMLMGSTIISTAMDVEDI